MGYIPPQYSSVPEWMRIVANAVNPLLVESPRTYVENLQGVTTGENVTTAERDQNVAAINAELANGTRLYFRSRIEISSTLFFASGSGLIGEGFEAKIYMPASAFDNTNNSTVDGSWAPDTRYGSNAVGLNFSGQIGSPYTAVTNVWLENFTLESEVGIGRYLRGIVGLNVSNCHIVDVEVKKFPTGVGICLSSVSSCTIIRPHVHDFADSTNWASHPQITGIEFDNDIVNSTASFACSVFEPYIHDLTATGSFLSTWGYETDGINICNNSTRVRIIGGRIDNVGEGIDTFGSSGIIDSIELNNCYNYGLKLIHGASRNVINNVSIENPGIAGVMFAGSSVVSQNIEGNVVTGITVRGVDPNGVWAGSDTACILFSDNGGTLGKPSYNQVIGAFLQEGANGKYGWLDTCTGTNNYGDNLLVGTGASHLKRIYVSSGGGSARIAGTTTYQTNLV